MVDKECVGLQVDVSSADAAVRYAGMLLEQGGYVLPEYSEAMVANFHKNGAYFVIAPNFAMPHARPEDGVSKGGVSLITLKTPVNFGTANDPVKVVMALATGSNSEHLDYMVKVAGILSEGGIVGKIYDCKTADELVNLLNK